MLEIKNLTVQYGSLKIVDNVSFSVRPQERLMVVGPNGAGKSTIVSAICQGVPYSGHIMIDGRDAALLRPKDAAKLFGVLTQRHHVEYAFTVEEIVRLGRYAFSKGILSQKSYTDDRKVEEALRITGLAELRSQSALTLSGGELQRTFLAQLLAQDPKLLILDEPTNHLDLVYQKQIFELIRDWLQAPGRAVMSVVHDLSLARAYGTHTVLLNRGKNVSCGKTEDVLTPEHLNQVYSMDVYAWIRGMLSQWLEDRS